ncbi:MAG: N-acetylmuramoyl-L-alanine amidase [Pseudomonadota bacterium]|nr:N-acetylmuramoyl-L-alanine amidase [Gammaproteobacteria bacterium]MBU1558878.1 N-acetylmuramoyl-L-alanine amidase [Gammaproteobacteria bacterium]MBU1628494.1 N-acetylmuramoyl-L-alanine amidase [Gammaproteobacteria bacterium]MBU1927297.1 N-acetylmuramoyl-L-alanine amidase [Gammaproteobacteria bacterium]MBU2546093.1 N-acetylmuramoyl-L-alanine amidase [Gammaproteobacteria bacterium]
MLRLNFLTGWLEDVRHHPSPCRDKRPQQAEIEQAVLCSIDLPAETEEASQSFCDYLFAGDSLQKAFKGQESLKISTHLLIDRQGMLTQYVSFYQRAWYAVLCDFNEHEHYENESISIGLMGLEGKPYAYGQYERLVQVMKTLMHYFNKINLTSVRNHAFVTNPKKGNKQGELFDWNEFKQVFDHY